jgi:hypothetical protein
MLFPKIPDSYVLRLSLKLGVGKIHSDGFFFVLSFKVAVYTVMMPIHNTRCQALDQPVTCPSLVFLFWQERSKRLFHCSVRAVILSIRKATRNMWIGVV